MSAIHNYYEFLEWDSAFFGFKVFTISETIDDNYLVDCITYLFEKKNAKLIYYFEKNRIKNLSEIQECYDIILADQKVTFVKKLQKYNHNFQDIIAYNKDYPEKDLIDLAIQSGIYSRFHIDPRIEDEKFRDLYKIWITNSVNKKIAKEVLIKYKDNQIAGFVTLGEKNNVADIGLIAVNSVFRGKGVGKSLMLAAENWFIKNTQHKTIQVVTQNNNKPACQLYGKLGYSPSSIDYFYHIWKKPKICH